MTDSYPFSPIDLRDCQGFGQPSLESRVPPVTRPGSLRSAKIVFIVAVKLKTHSTECLW